MRDTGIEPVTSSVSGKRSPTELIARYSFRTTLHGRTLEKRGADDETRTRDPHLGKVMRYQLRYIRIAPRTLYRCGARRNIIVLRASFQIPSPAAFFPAPIFYIRTIPKHTDVILRRQ